MDTKDSDFNFLDGWLSPTKTEKTNIMPYVRRRNEPGVSNMSCTQISHQYCHPNNYSQRRRRKRGRRRKRNRRREEEEKKKKKKKSSAPRRFPLLHLSSPPPPLSKKGGMGTNNQNKLQMSHTNGQRYNKHVPQEAYWSQGQAQSTCCFANDCRPKVPWLVRGRPINA